MGHAGRIEFATARMFGGAYRFPRMHAEAYLNNTKCVNMCAGQRSSASGSLESHRTAPTPCKGAVSCFTIHPPTWQAITMHWCGLGGLAVADRVPASW